MSKAVFEKHFWECYDKFREQATAEIGVPGYFRFITLLGGCEQVPHQYSSSSPHIICQGCLRLIKLKLPLVCAGQLHDFAA